MTYQPPQPPREYPGMPGHVPPDPNQPQATPKQRKTLRWILMSLGAAFVVLIGLTVSTHPSTPSPPQTPAPVQQGTDTGTPAAVPPAPVTTQVAPAVHHVIYKITGSAPSASVTYNSDGLTSIQQEQGVPVPWTKELDVPAGKVLTIVQVSAQNGGSGTITCTIVVDGKQIKTGTSTGQYAIASCDASIE